MTHISDRLAIKPASPELVPAEASDSAIEEEKKHGDEAFWRNYEELTQRAVETKSRAAELQETLSKADTGLSNDERKELEAQLNAAASEADSLKKQFDVAADKIQNGEYLKDYLPETSSLAETPHSLPAPTVQEPPKQTNAKTGAAWDTNFLFCAAAAIFLAGSVTGGIITQNIHEQTVARAPKVMPAPARSADIPLTLSDGQLNLTAAFYWQSRYDGNISDFVSELHCVNYEQTRLAILKSKQDAWTKLSELTTKPSRKDWNELQQQLDSADKQMYQNGSPIDAANVLSKAAKQLNFLVVKNDRLEGKTPPSQQQL